MSRSVFVALALVALLCLVPAHAQTTDDMDIEMESTGNMTTTGNSTTNSTASNTTEGCPLTSEAVANVDFTNASTTCADPTGESFCSDCLCSIANTLISGSPVFASLATNASAVNLNTLVEQCAGTLGPALLSALTADSLTSLAQCDLNAAAMMCGNTTETAEIPVEAAQGPVTPGPVQGAGAVRASSGARGVIVSALLAAPVLLALWMV